MTIGVSFLTSFLFIQPLEVFLIFTMNKNFKKYLKTFLLKILLAEMVYFISIFKYDIFRKKSPENKLDSKNDRDITINNVSVLLTVYSNINTMI